MSKYTDILKHYWGYDTFRPLQEDIIASVGEGKDTLGLMPTGGGKSITFQVPALARPGLCIVITPLIALMKDQVENLRKRGIKAAAIYSGMNSREINVVYDNCTFGDYKFLYLSPERLGTRTFLERLPKLKVSMLAVDESHCISQWGYDFRPSYLKIADIRELLPDVPVLAVTATATPQVAKDIQDKLHFSKAQLFQKSFARDNLIYALRYVEDKPRFVLKMLKAVEGTAIVYARSRQRTKEYAEFLQSEGFSADYYHAGLAGDEKDRKQKDWTRGTTRVIVATNAFGMGIDKPDVRLVVHVDLPDSLEAYFQEAGRAGRDGDTAYAVMLYANSDGIKMKKRVKDSFPEKVFVRMIYNKLFDYLHVALGVGQDGVFEFDFLEFCKVNKLPALPTYSAIKILERSEYLVMNEERENSSRLFYYDRYALISYAEHVGISDIIKSTLRRYTGLFSSYVYINEGVVARAANCSRQQVYDALKEISKAGLGHYVPQSSQPVVFLLQNRYPSSRISISRAAYDDLYTNYIKRVKAVLDYVTMRHRCRQQMLLEYFGEEIAPCGQCDVCLSKANQQLSASEYQNLSLVMLDKLRSKPLRLERLIDQLPYEESRSIAVLRTLLDDGKIYYNSQQELVIAQG